MADLSNKTFIGTGWSFPPTFYKAKPGVEMVSGLEDIKQSLQILLNTAIGERVMQAEYGSILEKMLFEPLNTSVTSYLQESITNSIYYHEPRIKPDLLDFEVKPNEGLVEVTVSFTVNETNTRSNVVFPFYLNEATNI